MSATWNRGKLSQLTGGTAASGTRVYSFGYNALGQRVTKTYSFTEGTLPSHTGMLIGSEKRFYYDNSGRLIAENTVKEYYGVDDEEEKIIFLYDESSIIGMQYTVGSVTTPYYFHRNPLGDVVGIYNTSGTLVAKYIYDAWGNCTISGETTDIAVAQANPIRYRGYYYDDDTGLYYCNARYYSPKWRRFISPDDTAYLDPHSVNGLNQYCYCNNDPINYYDPSGHSFLLTLGIFVATSLLTWGASMLFDEHLVSGAGLAATGLTALASGLLAFSLFTPVGMFIGGITMLAGLSTLAFSTAELQQGFTGENWMLDNGMDESLYYGLMAATSTIATLGSIASGITYKYQLQRITQTGRIDGLLQSGKHVEGYRGLRFASQSGKFFSIELHPNHNNHGIHLQFNQWLTAYPKFPGEFVLKTLWRYTLW